MRNFLFGACALVIGCSGTKNDGKEPPSKAPTGLKFERVDNSSALLAWDEVTDANAYVVLVDGADAAEVSDNEVSLDVGIEKKTITVVAKNKAGRSPQSTPFPALFGIRLKACASDSIAGSWTTSEASDASTSFEILGQSAKTCVDPTPRTEHAFSDLSACTTTGLAKTRGGIPPNTTVEMTLLSRDALGYLGSAKQSVTTARQACVCMGPDCSTSCGIGFNFDTLAKADIAASDLYIDANNSGTLTFPGGAVYLAGKTLCDITTPPTSGYTTAPTVTPPTHATVATYPPGYSYAAKTRSGRFVKLTLESSTITTGGTAPTFEIKFGYVVAGQGETNFSE